MPKNKPDKAGYAEAYRDVDFRRHPERYRVGRGEQGVLIAEPYKGEILPHWRFATPEKARASAEKIYEMFLAYKEQDDFVGMDVPDRQLRRAIGEIARRVGLSPSKPNRTVPHTRSSQGWAGLGVIRHHEENR